VSTEGFRAKDGGMATKESGRRWLLVGVGNAARVLAAQHPAASREGRITGTTRSLDKLAALRAAGIVPLHFDASPGFFERLHEAAAGARVLVSFPPSTDDLDTPVAAACASAAALVYVSSTGVYGERRGVIDEHTEPTGESESARRRLAAERTYRSVGATILRAPALYEATGGLPQRLVGAGYRLPGDGSGFVSRLHLVDLAQFIVAAWERRERGEPGETYVVGDASPSPHREVVAFLCERLGLPFPPSVPLAEAPVTLRGSRQIDSRHARRELGVQLRFPTFREGYADVRPETP
jgi:NAD dependent epimerase/dehydratase family enzyme